MIEIIFVKNSTDSIDLAEVLRSNTVRINSINQLEKLKHLRNISEYCCLIECILHYINLKINSKTENDYWELGFEEEKRSYYKIFRENIDYEICLTKNFNSALLPIMRTVKILSNNIIDCDWISIIDLINKMHACNNIIDFYINQNNLFAVERELNSRMNLDRRNYIDTSLMESKLITLNMQKRIIKYQIEIINFIPF